MYPIFVENKKWIPPTICNTQCVYFVEQAASCQDTMGITLFRSGCSPDSNAGRKTFRPVSSPQNLWSFVPILIPPKKRKASADTAAHLRSAISSTLWAPRKVHRSRTPTEPLPGAPSCSELSARPLGRLPVIISWPAAALGDPGLVVSTVKCLVLSWVSDRQFGLRTRHFTDETTRPGSQRAAACHERESSQQSSLVAAN